MHIVIIGGGIAGNTAASTIKKHSPETKVTLISEEAQPLYSACVLSHYLARSLERSRVFLKNTQDYMKEGITTILGEKVESVDASNKKLSLQGQTIPYDKLIIATGSKVLTPPIQGVTNNGVFSLKTISDTDRVNDWPGEKVVVIGSGFVGVEAAIALRRRGCQVQIVELLDWILPRSFDADPALLILKLLEKNGVQVSVQEKVKSIDANSKVNRVVTDKQTIDCDTVIMAAGMRPEIELARDAGLSIGKLGGIAVDDQMMSSLNDVYACGDCIESKDLISGKKTFYLLWHNAKQQAEIAAYNCLGNQRSYPGSMNITGVDIFGTQTVSVGLTATIATQDEGSSVEVIEKNWGADYLRLIMKDGFLVGVQDISRTKDIGLLLSAILRRENLKMADKSTGQSHSYLWWRQRIGEYCRS